MRAAGLRVTILQSDTGMDNIRFFVCDGGGNINASVSNRQPHEFRQGMSAFDGATMTDDDGKEVKAVLSSAGWHREVEYRGESPVTTAVLGGSELYIHSVCVD